MSTQRRGNRRRSSSCTDVARGTSRIWLQFIALFARAIAMVSHTVGTAPRTAVFSQSSWLATNSLQSDHLFAHFFRPVEQHTRSGSPPFRDAVRPADARSSLPLIPTPSELGHFHPSLPFCGLTDSFVSQPPAHTPAGQCRWTERYDGKRNLYFQYAA